MPEDRLALRLANIRRTADHAIRDGKQLSPHLIRAMCDGAKA